jgi:hypothetical protein
MHRPCVVRHPCGTPVPAIACCCVADPAGTPGTLLASVRQSVPPDTVGETIVSTPASRIPLSLLTPDARRAVPLSILFENLRI